jgi:lipopolysaccharide export system permease protein
LQGVVLKNYAFFVLKKLDIYIVKKFIGTFIFAVTLFLIISIVIDIVERIDDFIDSNATLGIIITEYYLPFIPWISGILFPLFVFLSVLFFTSKMSANSEIVASLGNGISFYRLLMPYAGVSILLAIFLYFGNHYIIPWSNAKKISFENTYFSTGHRASVQNIHIRLSKSEYIYMENYNHIENEGYKFSYEKFEDNKIVYKLKADKIEWDYAAKAWNMSNVVIREINMSGEKFRKEQKLNNIKYNFKPTDFESKTEIKEAMSTPYMNNFLINETKRGADNLEVFYVERLRRTTEPISLIILTLIGFAIASRKTRGGMGTHIAFGLGLSALYILFMRMNTTFASQAGLDPFIGLWMPNLVFAIVALVLLIKAQK